MEHAVDAQAGLRGGGRLAALRVVSWTLLSLIATLFAWMIASVLACFERGRGRLHSRVASLWGRALLAASGAHLVVEGREHLAPDEARILVANHASFLDPPAALAVFPGPMRFILKEELKSFPLIGWYLTLAGHFFLDRTNPREGHELIARVIERARRLRLSPIVFPEGTRSADGRLQPLKAGAFQLAVGSGLPVQPIAFLGTHEVLPKGARHPQRAATVRVRIGEPIATAGLEGSAGRKVLAGRVREALLALGVPDGAA